MRKKATTVITCVDEVKHIEKAVNSCLNQETSFEHEVIVVQAGENDRLKQKIPNEVKFERIPINTTVSESRNRGREISGADYVLFLDADDYSMPGRVQKSVELIEEGYDIVGQVNSSICLVNEKGEKTREFREKKALNRKRPKNYDPCDTSRIENYELMPPSSLCVRLEHAVFDPEENFTENYEFLLRSYTKGRRILPVCKDFVTRLQGKHKDSRAEQARSIERIKRKYLE
jgi:glycosyltransferase involved in cell wall biosynthesis